jgi:hypothetical protein
MAQRYIYETKGNLDDLTQAQRSIEESHRCRITPACLVEMNEIQLDFAVEDQKWDKVRDLSTLLLQTTRFSFFSLSPSIRRHVCMCVVIIRVIIRVVPMRRND